MAVLDRYASLPGFPFTEYYDDVEQYGAVQRYWLDVVRSVSRFDEQRWRPTEKPVDLEDDMYLGLVVDIENLRELKSIRIHAISREGHANFLLREDAETRALAADPDPDFPIAPGVVSQLVRTPAEALAASDAHLRDIEGCEIGVVARDFLNGTTGSEPAESFITGRELVAVTVLAEPQEAKVVAALTSFLQE